MVPRRTRGRNPCGTPIPTTVLDGAELRRSRLDGVVDVSSQDVAALLRQLRESLIPVPAVVDVVRSGHVTARGTVAGSIGEPVVDLLVSARDVSAGGVDAIQAAGAVHADPEAHRVEATGR